MIVKNIKDKIKTYYFLNPSKKLRVRQIEREVNVPLPSAIRYVKELVNERFLKKYEVANIVTFTTDRSSKYYIFEKKLFNLNSLFETDLIDYLVEELSNPIIIVFGSFSKGEDIENSDIDIYVETPSKKEISLKKFEKKLNRKIQVFRNKSIKKIKNEDLANNILNGIVLNGNLEVFK